MLIINNGWGWGGAGGVKGVWGECWCGFCIENVSHLHFIIKVQGSS